MKTREHKYVQLSAWQAAIERGMEEAAHKKTRDEQFEVLRKMVKRVVSHYQVDPKRVMGYMVLRNAVIPVQPETPVQEYVDANGKKINIEECDQRDIASVTVTESFKIVSDKVEQVEQASIIEVYNAN